MKTTNQTEDRIGGAEARMDWVSTGLRGYGPRAGGGRGGADSLRAHHMRKIALNPPANRAADAGLLLAAWRSSANGTAFIISTIPADLGDYTDPVE